MIGALHIYDDFLFFDFNHNYKRTEYFFGGGQYKIRGGSFIERVDENKRHVSQMGYL
jgi:hypothetical protein